MWQKREHEKRKGNENERTRAKKEADGLRVEGGGGSSPGGVAWPGFTCIWQAFLGLGEEG